MGERFRFPRTRGDRPGNVRWVDSLRGPLVETNRALSAAREQLREISSDRNLSDNEREVRADRARVEIERLEHEILRLGEQAGF